MPSVSVLKMHGQRSLSCSLSPGIAHPTLPISSKHDPFNANHRGEPRRHSSSVVPILVLSRSPGGLGRPSPLPCMHRVESPSGAGHFEGRPLVASGGLLIVGLYTQHIKIKNSTHVSIVKNSNFDMFKMKNSRTFSTHR